MNSVLNQPNGNMKRVMRVHRLVVLPDYQGMNIGTTINDFFGKYYLSHGYRYNIRTTHQRMISHLKNSIYWEPNVNNNKNNLNHVGQNLKYANLMNNQKMLERVCASYEYVGEKNIKPNKLILIEDYDSNKIDILKEKLRELQKDYYLVIVHGTATSNDDIDDIAKELGITMDPLYIKRLEKYNKKKKYENIKPFEF